MAWKSCGDAPHARAHPEAVELAQLTNARPPSIAPPAGSGSSSSRSSRSSHCSSNASPLSSSSSTVKPGRQPGLDGELEQQPAGERVQRADRRVVETFERGGRGLGAVDPVEPRSTHPRAQLGGRLLGERDGGDARDVDPVVDEVDDAADERAGLAGACSGLDEQRRAEVGPDADAGGLVGRQIGSSGPPSVVDRSDRIRVAQPSPTPTASGASSAGAPTTSPNQRASRGSCRLRSQSAQRSAVPSSSGSQ